MTWNETRWTDSRAVASQVLARWMRGDLLRALAGGESVFPLRIRLKGPTSAELTSRFPDVRSWVAELTGCPSLRIDWRAFRHPVMGAQRLPQAVWIDNIDTAIDWIGKRQDADTFLALLAQTRARLPPLVDWLAGHPLQVVQTGDQWPRLLDVVAWVIEHPLPRIYLRQVDLPGIDSKFIESHRAVLSELLDLVLPPAAIAAEHRGVDRFAARYGFLDKPGRRVRFRVLDADIALLPGPALPDVTLDAASFAALRISARHIFITENEINFLAFPAMPDAIVIFGEGYGWESLGQARWLSERSLYYWGDIDTHGFAILDRLRNRLPHVQSFLMDRATLMAHERLWGREEQPSLGDLHRLTVAERALFDALRDNRIRPGLRLEQEQIGFRWVRAAIQTMMAEGRSAS